MTGAAKKKAAAKPKRAAKKAAVKRAAKKSAAAPTAAPKRVAKKSAVKAAPAAHVRIQKRGEMLPVSATADNPLRFYAEKFGANPRIHDEKDLGEIRQSIEQFGFCSPLLVSDDNVVLDGNGRLMVLREMGQQKVSCWRAHGLSDEEQRLVGLNMNAIAKRARDDPEVLEYQISKAVLAGFSLEKLDDLGWDKDMTRRAADVGKDTVEKFEEAFGIKVETEIVLPSSVEKGFGGFKQEGDLLIPARGLEHMRSGETPSTPLTWHGGKMNLLPYLVPLVESAKGATFFMEAFAGGAALLWGLRVPFVTEVLNDRMSAVVKFWKTMQSDFDAFNTLAHERGLHAYDHYVTAQDIMAGRQQPADDIELSWALWYATMVTHSHTGTGGFVINYEQCAAKGFRGKLERMTATMMERLKHVTILNRDAVELIQVHGKDSRSLIYLDPPYVSAAQGFYAGYEQEHFDALLEALSGLQCRWILSSYPNERLEEYREKFGWKQARLTAPKSSHPGSLAGTGEKVEVITTNFAPTFRQGVGADVLRRAAEGFDASV